MAVKFQNATPATIMFMGCVGLRYSMLKYIGELGYRSLKKRKSKYFILNIDSVSFNSARRCPACVS